MGKKERKKGNYKGYCSAMHSIEAVSQRGPVHGIFFSIGSPGGRLRIDRCLCS